MYLPPGAAPVVPDWRCRSCATGSPRSWGTAMAGCDAAQATVRESSASHTGRCRIGPATGTIRRDSVILTERRACALHRRLQTFPRIPGRYDDGEEGVRLRVDDCCRIGGDHRMLRRRSGPGTDEPGDAQRGP